jgi:short-subunit dehydrogenase
VTLTQTISFLSEPQWSQSMRKETVVITGASSGIGEELAKLFARNDYDLVLVARSADKLKTLAGQLKQDAGVRVLVEIYPGVVRRKNYHQP